MDMRKTNLRVDGEGVSLEDNCSPGNEKEYFVRVGSGERTAFAGRARVRVAKEMELEKVKAENTTREKVCPILTEHSHEDGVNTRSMSRTKEKVMAE